MAEDPLDTILKAIEKLDKELRGDITTMRGDITTLRVDLMARMDRLQDTMTTMRDDMSVNYGASDAAQRANDNTRELVRLQGEAISVIVRQVRRLQEQVRNLT